MRLFVIILLQKGRGGGVGAALGGAGGNTAFGAKTGDVFTVVTVVFAAVFLLLAVVSNFAFRQTGSTTAAAPAGASGTGPETAIPVAPGQGEFFSAVGRFVFVNNAGTRVYALVQAEEESGMAFDWAIEAFNVADMP